MEIIRKYAGKTITFEQLTGEVGEAVRRTALDLKQTETELARCADKLAETADKLRTVINAEPGDRTPTLNPIGELQHDRTDMLIALRDQQITSLHRLIHLAT